MEKVVWAEGIFLSQQHLQTWDAQLERSLQLRHSLLNPFCWGLISLSIDREALSLARFQIQEVTVLFRDGRLASYQTSVEDPLECELKSSGGDNLGIYLAIPANHHVAGISGYPQHNRLSGWQSDYQEIEDRFDTSRRQEILLAKPNLLLISDDQALGQFMSLKIAEVTHDGDFRYRTVDNFIPPVCRLAAAPMLLQRTGRIIETLNAKRKMIEQSRAGCDGGTSEFAKTDPNNHGLLRNLNWLIPQLRHIQQCPDLHPEELYRLLCQVAGAFCTYHDQATIDQIPPYNQDGLTTVFEKIEAMLTMLLELKTVAKARDLHLEQESSSLLSCKEIPGETFLHETFFLEALYDSDDPNWITDFSRQVKVTARSVIETVVASALPGVRLIHTQRPPTKLSTRSGYEYFRLEARGDFWEQMKGERSLAIFLPHLFNTADVRLVTVEE
jgi:type VI secretion system protein ImpJ